MRINRLLLLLLLLPLPPLLFLASWLLTSTNCAHAQHVIDRSDYASMAFLSARMGRTAEAVRYFDKAIEKSPEDYSLYMNRATAFLNMSQPKKGIG